MMEPVPPDISEKSTYMVGAGDSAEKRSLFPQTPASTILFVKQPVVGYAQLPNELNGGFSKQAQMRMRAQFSIDKDIYMVPIRVERQ